MKPRVIVLAIFTVFVLTVAIFETETDAKTSYQEDQIIRYSQLDESDRKQVECLSQNIYYEARGESKDGHIAVALVTMNRSLSKLYPDNVCHVVREKLGKTCQFTWWCDPKLRSKATTYNYTKLERKVYDDIRKLALHLYVNQDNIEDLTGGAIFYHANYVNPRWKYEKTAQIGKHIFYKKR